jgi:hypothetical protein
VRVASQRRMRRRMRILSLLALSCSALFSCMFLDDPPEDVTARVAEAPDAVTDAPPAEPAGPQCHPEDDDACQPPDDVSEVPPDDTSGVLALTQPPDDVSRALIAPPDVPIEPRVEGAEGDDDDTWYIPIFPIGWVLNHLFGHHRDHEDQ